MNILNENIFTENMKLFNNSSNNFFQNMPDMTKYGESIKKNTEAISNVNQKIIENAQTISQQYTNLLQKNITHIYDNFKNMISSQNIEDATTHNQQCCKNIMENYLMNAKDVMERNTKTGIEVLNMLSQNIVQSMKYNSHHNKDQKQEKK